jgi:hypothetical protein
MIFASRKGCDTVILTSANGEALQNRDFLLEFSAINKKLKDPFINIELQTTGVLLNEESLAFLKHKIGVKTISLSLANLFIDSRNWELCGIASENRFNILTLCRHIKEFNFNLRLSLNMTKDFEAYTPAQIFAEAKEFKANQVTFRKLYSIGTNYVANWINTNKCSDDYLQSIENYIEKNGTKLEKLSFGARKYSVNGISTVIDDNCMAAKDSTIDNVLKYFIIRENGRLYTRWDDEGSLIF